MNLPNNFPTEGLGAANRRKLEWYYRRYVEAFYQEYRFGHFLLAAYAAVPALLTADLLYKLWQNFHQYKWSAKTVRTHRVAVADLLLSPLCREVGFEVYEMEPAIRQAFLEWQTALTEDPSWQSRELASVRAIAQFLQEYHHRSNPARQRWGAAYEEVQEWNTLAFIEPETLQKRMWQKLRQSVAENRETETLRVLNFWSRTETQLGRHFSESEREQWRQNARFAQAWKALLQYDTSFFTEAIASDPAYQALLDDNPEGGIAVHMPARVKQEVDRIQEAAKQNEIREESVWALLVGVDQYAHPDLTQLSSSRNDVADFQQFLEDATDYLGMPLEVVTLIDREATEENVWNNFRQMMLGSQNGDHCVFFFTGHSANSVAQDPKEKDGRFYLYDSDPTATPDFSFLSHVQMENWLFDFLTENKRNCLLVLDLPQSPEENSQNNFFTSDYSQGRSEFDGSLVVFYGAKNGQNIYEGTFGQENRGIFPFAFLDVFRDKGFNISFNHLIETTRLRMTQLTNRQTPEMKAFPAEMAAAFLFSHEVHTDEKTYRVSFDPAMSRYVINAGARQGMTPSLEFMPTLVRLEDGRELTVAEVFRDESSLGGFTGDGDTTTTYPATLVQTAFPKIQIAFDPGIDEKMEAQLRSVIQSYNIYYIDIRNKLEDAKYFIHSWQDNYFLSRQTSSRDAHSGSIQPLFNLEPDPFELIKQMEYIAQWSGVVEFQPTHSSLNSQAVKISIGLIEGPPLTRENLNSVEPDRVLENPGVIEVTYRSEPYGRSLQPGLQIRLQSVIEQLIFVSVLYLDSTYGIQAVFRSDAIEPGVEIPVPFTFQGETYITIPLNFEEKYLDLNKTEIYDYLKIFISTEPLDVEPLQQESLELDKQVERTIIMRQEQKKGKFVIGETDWTAITIPIKIRYEQQPAAEEPQQQQQSGSPFTEAEEKGFEPNFSGTSDTISQPERTKQLQDLIARGSLKEAISLLLQSAESTDLENEIVLLSGRFNNLESQNRQGIIARDDYQRSRNRITYSLLEYVRLLENE